MSSLAEEIEEEAGRLGDPERERQLKRYFREPIEAYGLTMAQSKTLTKKYHHSIKCPRRM